jgi:hypothetical protein
MDNVHIECIKILINYGFNVNEKDFCYAYSPFHQTASAKCIELLIALADYSSNFNGKHKTSRKRHYGSVKIWLELFLM